MTRSAKQFMWALWVFVALACQPDGTTKPTVDANASELELSYGGLKETDEEPAFGDENLKQDDDEDLIADEDGDDRFADEIEEAQSFADTKTIRLRLRYGNLAGSRLARVAQWPWRVTAPGGFIHRVEIIADRLERPNLTRPSIREVRWQTQPRLGQDGAEMLIEYRSVNDAPIPGVVLGTESLMLRIPLDQLGDYEKIHKTKQGSVFVSATQVVKATDNDDPGCVGGVVEATVGKQDKDGVSAFRGIVTTQRADQSAANARQERGYVKGIFGVRKDGQSKFFAKVIDDDGRLLGRLRGLYEDADDGLLKVGARIHARGGAAIGVFRGQITSADEESGTLIGRWELDCDPEPTISRDQLPPESDEEEKARPTERPASTDATSSASEDTL